MNDKIAHYRQHYRQHNVPDYYRGLVHLSITLSLSIGSAIYLAIQLEAVRWWEWLTIPVTFLYANLVEYVAHRYPMHRPFKGIRIIFQRHARQHHRFFTHENMAFDSSKDFIAVLFPPYLIVFFLIAFALPMWLLIYALLNSNVAHLFVITALSYFALYEIMHTAYHLKDDHWLVKQKWFRGLRQLHLNHHQPKLMTHYNFNITLPIGDWLFGTYYSDQSRAKKIDKQTMKDKQRGLGSNSQADTSKSEIKAS